MIRNDDPCVRALHARQEIPACAFRALVKSEFYLVVGFVGAAIAVIALRDLAAAQTGLLSALTLVVAAGLGIGAARFAWRRASRVLRSGSSERSSDRVKVQVDSPTSVLLAAVLRG